MLFFCAAPGHAQVLTAAAELPSAPLPQRNPLAQKNTDNAANLAAPHTLAKFYWHTIPPEYQAQPLSAYGKLKYSVHEVLDPLAIFPAAISASWGNINNSDPKYGTDAGAWGQRFGAAAVRQASFRFFSDGAFPILLKEDPRYYRLGSGYSFWRRTEYSLTRVFIGRTDSGNRTFNYSDVGGRALGAALTQAYYPDDSRSATVVFRTFGVALGGQAGINFVREFWKRARF
jgi:hypothetical protein